MILLSVVCVLLYALGGVLAYEISRERNAAERLVVVALWPSLAVFLAFGSDDEA